jgi:hypothetical protein
VKIPCLFVFILLFLGAGRGFAYPNFIGYGYNACATCHYNGQGGGALNDYGRALFASEITARDIFPASVDDEELGARSGFLGKKELPWWFRPGVKYRGLWFQSSPGSAAKSEKFYNMQSDLNLNFFADPAQKYALITTLSYTQYPRTFGTSVEDKTPYWFMKEYYLRWQYSKTLWLYAGQLEKTFGLRQVDHTAASRTPIGLGQFDTSQGVIVDWNETVWDVAGNIFFGNDGEKSAVKQKGFAATGEYEILERFRVGGSLLNSKSDEAEWTRVAAHSRLGLSKGSSLLSEIGFYQNKASAAGSPSPTWGSYVMLENWILLRRGYNLLSTLEYSKADIQSTTAERMRWSIGGIMFPLPRTEVRLMAVNGKNYNPQTDSPDSWQAQCQVHVSW